MDPNVSTEVPPQYTSTSHLDPTTNLTVKLYTFGFMAFVIVAAISYGVYLVFYRDTHRKNKAIRHEKEVRLLSLIP